MQDSLSTAIEFGKQRMRESLSSRNNYTHVQAVETHAQAIYQELQAKGEKLPDVEVLQIAVWWHDTFKALHSGRSLYFSVIEGFAAAELTQTELAHLLDHDDLNLVLNAIRYHNQPWLYPVFCRLIPNQFNIIGQILIEADTIDSVREDRPAEKLNWKNLFSSLPVIKLVNLFRAGSYRFFIKSEYARKALRVS